MLVRSINCYHCYVSELAKAEIQNNSCLALPGAIIGGITASVPLNYLSEIFCSYKHSIF